MLLWVYMMHHICPYESRKMPCLGKSGSWVVSENCSLLIRLLQFCQVIFLKFGWACLGMGIATISGNGWVVLLFCL